MNLNIILILLFLIFGGVLSVFKPNNSKIIYIILCSLCLILSVTFRSLDYGAIGADTWNYYDHFKIYHDADWQEIKDLIIQRYIQNDEQVFDVGFVIFERIIGYFTNSFHIFTTIADLLFFIPFGILLNRYCDKLLEVFFAFLFYLALMHTFALYGGRQFYAIGFGIMFYLCYDKKKYFWAFFWLLIGCSFHLSLLLVLIPFILSFLPSTWIKWVHAITFIAVPFVVLYPNQMISFMGNFIGSEKYADYGTNEISGGASTFIILIEILSLICLILTNTKYLEDRQFKNLYATIPAVTVFAPLIVSSGTMIRVVAYSYVYLSVLLPCIFKKLPQKTFYSLLSISSAILIIFILSGSNFTYQLFWKVDPVFTW